ncbi:MAG: YeeE/YedE family protein [Myxococcota bacterium]
MDSFAPISALIGGAFIGVSASMMLLLNGRIAGISGLLGGLLSQRPSDVNQRGVFLAGLLVGGLVLGFVMPGAFVMEASRSTGALIVAGLLVGFGTRLGNGCTSGHGVCGISRMSPRALAATGTFMIAGFVTVGLITQLLGGSI